MPILRTALLGLILASAAPIQALDVHVDLYGGIFRGSEDTKPVEKRVEFGLMSDLSLDALPFGFCANAFYNKDDVSDATSGLTKVATAELQLGLFKQFRVPVVHPFIAGGVTILKTTLQSVGSAETDENTIGAWAEVGARMNIALFDFGVAAGYTWAEVKADGENIDVGGWRVGAFLGIGF